MQNAKRSVLLDILIERTCTVQVVWCANHVEQLLAVLLDAKNHCLRRWSFFYNVAFSFGNFRPTYAAADAMAFRGTPSLKCEWAQPMTNCHSRCRSRPAEALSSRSVSRPVSIATPWNPIPSSTKCPVSRDARIVLQALNTASN